MNVAAAKNMPTISARSDSPTPNTISDPEAEYEAMVAFSALTWRPHVFLFQGLLPFLNKPLFVSACCLEVAHLQLFLQ